MASNIPNPNQSSSSSTGPATAAAAANPLAAAEEVGDDCDKTEVKRATGWWMPNMLTNDVSGYKENHDNLSYGLEDFRRQ